MRHETLLHFRGFPIPELTGKNMRGQGNSQASAVYDIEMRPELWPYSTFQIPMWLVLPLEVLVIALDQRDRPLIMQTYTKG